MSELYLVSTLLMGLLVVVVSFAVMRSGQRATPTARAAGGSGFAEWSGRSHEGSRLVALASNPMVWTLSFVLLAIVFLGGAVVLVADLSSVLSAGAAAAVETAVMGIGAAVLVGYVFLGAYFSVRERSGQSAAGVGVAAALVGLLLLVAITFALVTA